MELRISSIPLMLDFLSKLGTGSANTALLKRIFSHDDYQFEIRRYGLSSIEPLIVYFSRLKSIKVNDIPDLCDERKSSLRDKHDLWLDCVSDPQKYYNRYKKVKDILCEENILDFQHKLAALEEIDEQFQSYWWNPHLYENEVQFLAQTPIYSFGNELFGCIFDAFGLEVLFECFYHPAKAIEYFNKTNCGYVISE